MTGPTCYKMNTARPKLAIEFCIGIAIKMSMRDQGCHVSGKSQGKTKFSPGQGIVREF